MHGATYHYDHDLRMDYTIDRNGRRRDFVYRADGLLLVETWRNSGGTVVDTLTYTYDADGNLLTAANNASLYTFGYDPDNRLTNMQEPFGLALTYSYDQADRVTTVQDSKGGVLTSVYDAGNRLTNRQFSAGGSPSLSVKLDWTPRDELGTVTYYRDVNYSQVVGRTLYDSYDDAVVGQLKHLRHQNSDGSAVLGEFTYTYDAGQRLTTQVLDGVATTYGYDAANRLTSENGSPYGYDAAGNRNDAGFVPTLSNQLQQDNMFTYSYDAEGNLISKVNKSTGETVTYSYDNVNHLLSVVDTTAPGLEIDYSYDALGQRIERRQVAGGMGNPDERYGYDRGHVWVDLDSGNNPLARRFYLDGVDQVFARIAYAGGLGTLAYYLTDRQGSVRRLMDTTGAVVNTVTYADAYGASPTDSVAAQGDRYKYTGREYDKDTGLQYNQARYNDPRTERWTSQDPLGDGAGDANLYRYVGDDPTNARDSQGLFDEELFWENVEKRVPGMKAWWQGFMRGQLVQRNANWNPFTLALFRSKVSGTYERDASGSLRSTLYLHEGFDEIEAARAFIDQAQNGFFASYWQSRNLDDPLNYPKAGEDWREWYRKAAAQTTLQGAQAIGLFYSLALQGGDWAITLSDLAQGEIGFSDAVTLFRVLPLSKVGQIKIFNRAGEKVYELTAQEARTMAALRPGVSYRPKYVAAWEGKEARAAYDRIFGGRGGTASKVGETASTAKGKSIHKAIADARRASGEFDLVQAPFTTKAGNPILVSKRVDLKTGLPQPGSPLQEVVPDAVSFRRKLILDDKPLGRPIAKDRQEIIRFIKGYEQREGNLPEVIGITRYDPKTGRQVLTELYSPKDFLP
jgi:RHS repeat-associated protein